MHPRQSTRCEATCARFGDHLLSGTWEEDDNTHLIQTPVERLENTKIQTELGVGRFEIVFPKYSTNFMYSLNCRVAFMFNFFE